MEEEPVALRISTAPWMMRYISAPGSPSRKTTAPVSNSRRWFSKVPLSIFMAACSSRGQLSSARSRSLSSISRTTHWQCARGMTTLTFPPLRFLSRVKPPASSAEPTRGERENP